MVESLFQGDNYQAVKKLLDVAAMRHEALASNIANVETPGYKRLDVDKTFEAELRSDLRAGDVRDAAGLQPRIAEDSTARGMRSDGNNVQLDRELLAMTENSTNFDVLTQFASSSLKQLRTAITGRNV
jgi:flagellar basal-body rod protein FlgB